MVKTKTIANSEKNAKGSHPGGRPTKYTPDMSERLEGYMINCPDVLPSKAGFAVFVGVCENTLTNWGGEYPEFLRALGRLHTRQHAELMNRGLDGTYNAALAKLMLCSNHGHRERSDQTSGSLRRSLILLTLLPAPTRTDKSNGLVEFLESPKRSQKWDLW